MRFLKYFSSYCMYQTIAPPVEPSALKRLTGQKNQLVTNVTYGNINVILQLNVIFFALFKVSMTILAVSCHFRYSSAIKEWNLHFAKKIATIHLRTIKNKNHKIWSKQAFLKILFSTQWCLFEISGIFIMEVRICIYMY